MSLIPQRLGLIITLGILLFAAAYLEWKPTRKPSAPIVPVVSKCGELKPGMKRVGEKHGYQFDFSMDQFRLGETTQDTPPFIHEFGLRPVNDMPLLRISFGPENTSGTAPDANRVFSRHVEVRKMFDDAGHAAGEDSWGYLTSGERWRQVRLAGGWVSAEYGFVNENEAALFDRVVTSVCLETPPGS